MEFIKRKVSNFLKKLKTMQMNSRIRKKCVKVGVKSFGKREYLKLKSNNAKKLN